MLRMKLLVYLFAILFVAGAVWAAVYFKFIPLPDGFATIPKAIENFKQLNKDLADLRQQMDPDVQQKATTTPPSQPKTSILDKVSKAINGPQERKIYKWRDAAGNIFFTDAPPPPGVQMEIITMPAEGEPAATLPPPNTPGSKSGRASTETTGIQDALTVPGLLPYVHGNQQMEKLLNKEEKNGQ